MVYVIHLVYFGSDPNVINATVVKGILGALTPISIIWGAVLLTKTMRLSGAAQVVMDWLTGITSNRGAQLMLIGKTFAKISGQGWQYVPAFLGALGYFFSGSATVSNLNFGGIQDSISRSVGLDQSLVLSLQPVGAAMGNMVCINNIVAVCSIMGNYNQEGFILKRTVIPMGVYRIIAGLLGLAFKTQNKPAVRWLQNAS